VYNKRRLRLHEPVAESIIVLHESRRFCARRIVETSPVVIQKIVRNSLRRAGALSDADGDNSSESGSSADPLLQNVSSVKRVIS
jgi:hypothetical protein